jgi:murein DD-endopeptidase MepM/ murein hydrolase activator NlpD
LIIGTLILFSLYFVFTRLEGEKPTVEFSSSLSAIGSSGHLTCQISDKKTGVRKIWIALERDGKDLVLYENTFPRNLFSAKSRVHDFPVDITIDPKKLGLNDGPVTLIIKARDNSLRGWFGGNLTTVEKNIAIDTQPPVIELMTKDHNLVPGGVGLAIYKVAETLSRTGVVVGDNFFPGYKGYFKDPNMVMVFFALRHDQGPGTVLAIEATDLAGNTSKTGLPNFIAAKAFNNDTINITDTFLESTISGFQADGYNGPSNDNLKKFLWINSELRKRNEQHIKSVGPFTDRDIYWKGPFLRLPASATRANFADHRSYVYNKNTIDSQYHLGVDLASLQQCDVPAANKGKVIMAEMIGIYGNTIILDHGYGLFSIYSHLSSFRAKVGDMVERGAVIANSGATGLAGGDHLHYSMIVHNVFVNPIQWWDPSWIKNNVTSKIDDVQSRIGK